MLFLLLDGNFLMSHKLSFNLLYNYNSNLTGITVPLILQFADKSVDIDAKIDTGATHCIFRRQIAEALCLDLEKGIAKNFALANASILQTYGHELNLSILDITYTTIVYFAVNEDLTRDVLGRNGFLYLFRLGIIDYDSALYISKYDD